MTVEPTTEPPRGRYLLTLSLAALGVVYGDIGTSPLYAIRECFYGKYGVPVSPANVLGVLSLIVWSLILVVSVKYLVFVMRADNRGEGGILALMALVVPSRAPAQGRSWRLAVLGLFGAALLYGDGMITPAISVLSAMEGLEVATPLFRPFVVPGTVVILVGLFLFQRRGTAKVGAVFGPVTFVWFVVLALLGIRGILAEDHGVDCSRITWVTFEEAHVAEFRDPPNVERAPAGSKLEEMLLAGEVDAMVSGDAPVTDSRIVPVIPEADAAALVAAELIEEEAAAEAAEAIRSSAAGAA